MGEEYYLERLFEILRNLNEDKLCKVYYLLVGMLGGGAE